MPQIEIPFREWLPDQPDHNNPGLVEAKNAYLSAGGWQPLKGAASTGPITAFNWEKEFGLYGAGNVYLYTYQDTIYAIGSGGTVINSHAFAPSSNYEYADFARFGNAVYVASPHGVALTPHTLLKVDITNPAPSYSSVAGVDAGTSIARVANQLAMGGVDDAGYNPLSVRFSGFNQPDSWDVSDLTQANIVEMDYASLGRVVAVVGGPAPMIFQSEGVTRISYAAPPRGFNQRLIWSRPGPQHPNAIVQVGSLYYFLTQEGVWVVNGSRVINISDGLVSDWIASVMTSPDDVVHGSYHRENKSIFWGIGGSSSEPFSKTLVLSLETRSFSEMDTEYYGAARGESFELKRQTRTMVPESGVTANSKLTSFDGDNLQSTLTTGHLASAGKRTFVDGVEPIYAGSGATAALSGKERIRDAASFGTYVAEEASTGIADVTSDARSTATSIKFAAGETWSDFSGVVANVGGAGER